MNTKNLLLTGLALVALVGPGWAQGRRPSDRQEEKNAMRNLGVGLGIAALGSAAQGHTGTALVLGATAALAGKQYEDDRKAQRDEDRYGRYDSRDRYDRYDRYDSQDRRPVLSRWERERIERERREFELRERREQERREREEREARLRWERQRRDRDGDRDRDCHRH